MNRYRGTGIVNLTRKNVSFMLFLIFTMALVRKVATVLYSTSIGFQDETLDRWYPTI